LQVTLDGQAWTASDAYCIEPECDCEEVRIRFLRELRSGGEVQDLGTVSVNPERGAEAQFLAHGGDRVLLKKLWAAWCEQIDVAALLRSRREKMRQIGPEIHQLRAAQRKPLANSGGATGPNDRCPCGSGKKFKRCCMGKSVSPS
jgi:hypothetical protein